MELCQKGLLKKSSRNKELHQLILRRGLFLAFAHVANSDID